MGDLVRLPGLGNLVLADDQAGDVGDHGEQVHFPLPAGLGELAFLAVHGGRGPGGHVSWIAGHGPGPARDGPGARGTSRRRAPRGNSPRPAASASFSSGFPPACAVLPHGTRRGRDRGVERGGGHARGQGSLELVGVQQPREPVQHRGGRRDPQPGPRADPAAVPGQRVLVPARRGLRDRQRPAVRGRHARDQHRYQRGQRMPLPPPAPRIGQEAVQRSRSGTGPGAAPAGKWRLMQSVSHDEATGAVLSVTV